MAVPLNVCKTYFIAAGKNLTYGNMRRQMTDSLEDKPLPKLSEELQKHTFWELGSKEEHFKYRNAVMQTYIFMVRVVSDRQASMVSVIMDCQRGKMHHSFCVKSLYLVILMRLLESMQHRKAIS